MAPLKFYKIDCGSYEPSYPPPELMNSYRISMMSRHITSAQRVLMLEANAISRAAAAIQSDFDGAVTAILKCSGKVVVTGMGKSGHVGRKIAATLSSTGTTSVFLHPAEAIHGDLGIVRREDVLLLISNSGETEEVVRLLPFLRENENVLIAMTARRTSTLGRLCHHLIATDFGPEACPLQLAPTTSTTVTLALGDALAVALMEARDFDERGFARFHPGGSLGRRLLGKVQDFAVPAVTIREDTEFTAVLSSLANSKMGIVCVLRDENLAGVITDGDLRRALAAYGAVTVASFSAGAMMNSQPKRVEPSCSCTDADALMHSLGINSLITELAPGTYGIYQNMNRKA